MVTATLPEARSVATRSRQSGAVLVVSLVILLVVTMLAISSMQSSSLEERMAGNTNDRNLAFQSTESALREAEVFVEGISSLGNFTGSAGLFGRTDAEPSYADAATWSSTRSWPASRTTTTRTAPGARPWATPSSPRAIPTRAGS